MRPPFVCFFFFAYFVGTAPAAAPQPSSAPPPRQAGSNPQASPPTKPDAAQGQEPPQRVDQTITRTINLVDVLFTVLSRRNNLVPDLEKENFKVFDNNIQQTIRFFTLQTHLPLRTAMLLDTSNSIRDRIKFEQHPAVNFLYTVLRHNKDDAFVMTFDDKPQT